MLRSWQRQRSQGAVPGGGAIKHNWLIKPFALANNAVHLKKKKKKEKTTTIICRKPKIPSRFTSLSDAAKL